VLILWVRIVCNKLTLSGIRTVIGPYPGRSVKSLALVGPPTIPYGRSGQECFG
jgi:hypothetical protein